MPPLNRRHIVHNGLAINISRHQMQQACPYNDGATKNQAIRFCVALFIALCNVLVFLVLRYVGANFFFTHLRLYLSAQPRVYAFLICSCSFRCFMQYS